MEVLNSTIAEQRSQWLSVWRAWSTREVFAHPGYLEAFSNWSGGSPRCAIYETKAGVILYPFFLRPISDSDQFDITSPYGYGGAFFINSTEEDSGEFVASFWESFDFWCRDVGVVSEFVRFALPPTALTSYPGVVRTRYCNVVRRLDLTEEELWMDVRHKVRKNVKRAVRDGVGVVVDENGERFEEFLDIYEQTMDRREAASAYYFDADFFSRLQDKIDGQCVYFHAVKEQKVVASELVLVSAESVYSFLGGTDPEHFASRPNDLLKHEVCLWAMRNGKKRFVLGGGKSPDDGIYRYKLGFAPDGAVPFQTGERVIDQQAYDHFTARMMTDATDFFPAYRAA